MRPPIKRPEHVLSLPWPCSILVLLGWARIFRPFKEPRNRFPAWCNRSRNRFLGSISAYINGLWIPFPLLYIFTTAEAEALRETTQHGVLPCLQLEEMGGGAMIRSIQRCNTMATLTLEEFRRTEYDAWSMCTVRLGIIVYFCSLTFSPCNCFSIIRFWIFLS